MFSGFRSRIECLCAPILGNQKHGLKSQKLREIKKKKNKQNKTKKHLKTFQTNYIMILQEKKNVQTFHTLLNDNIYLYLINIMHHFVNVHASNRQVLEAQILKQTHQKVISRHSNMIL